MVPRLLEKYRKEAVLKIMAALGYKNKMQVTEIKKIVINMGVGQGAHDIKIIDDAAASLSLIAGQKAVITRAKKAIANFKIREGDPIGCKVTLRKNNMYEFLDRFVNVALPRIRDFRGISSKSFDEQGNFTVGLNDHAVFPEIEYDKIQRALGMDITIVFEKGNREQNLLLLKLLGMPFRESDKELE